MSGNVYFYTDIEHLLQFINKNLISEFEQIDSQCHFYEMSKPLLIDCEIAITSSELCSRNC